MSRNNSNVVKSGYKNLTWQVDRFAINSIINILSNSLTVVFDFIYQCVCVTEYQDVKCAH